MRVRRAPGAPVRRGSQIRRLGHQLSRVVYECLGAAAHDRVLVSNVDASLLQPIMGGLRLVGPEGAAFCSFSERWRARTPAAALRYASYRASVLRARDAPFTGYFWVWRPALRELLSEEDYRAVRDGIDELVYNAVRRSPAHEAATSKEIGAAVRGRSHMLQPWSRFKAGVYVAADMHRRRGAVSRLGRARIAARVIRGSAAMLDANYWRGFAWGRSNPGHPAVRAAASADPSEWAYSGSEHLRGAPVRGGGTGWGA